LQRGEKDRSRDLTGSTIDQLTIGQSRARTDQRGHFFLTLRRGTGRHPVFEMRQPWQGVLIQLDVRWVDGSAKAGTSAERERTRARPRRRRGRRFSLDTRAINRSPGESSAVSGEPQRSRRRSATAGNRSGQFSSEDLRASESLHPVLEWDERDCGIDPLGDTRARWSPVTRRSPDEGR